MFRLLASVRWLALGLLAAAVIAIPSPARADKPLTEEDKKKQVEAIEKQIQDLQKQLEATKKGETPPATSTGVPEGTLPESVGKQYTWRQIGPANMAGRVTAMAVVESEPTTYYIATGSGGLLKTVNNGTTFDVIFDKQSTVSIGDVAIAPSNPNIVWVGSGEANPRNSVSYGDGIYKSTDAGKTFENMGLNKTFQIGKILIHPKNPDIVYAGAMGRLYGPNEDRGLFKTTDGGKNWTKVLFVDDKTGVIDARFDPQDPETLIVAMWERKRDEFDGFFGEAPVPDAYGPIVTHGAGGGLFKSTDGGKNWKKLNDEKLKNGLPYGKLGRIGLDYSRKTKGLLVAIIDTDKVGTGITSMVYMGIVGADNEGGGAKVSEVTEGGPAAKAGLKPGDIVLKADDTKIERYDDFVDYFVQKNPGDKIKVTIKRDGKEEVIEVTLGKRETPAPATGTGGRKGGGKGSNTTGSTTGSATTTSGKEATPATVPPIAGIMLEKGDTLRIASVTKDGPAEKAGIKAGDTIVFVDSKKVSDFKEYTAVMVDKKAGDKIKFTVIRDSYEKVFDVTVIANPRPVGATSTPPPATTQATTQTPTPAPKQPATPPAGTTLPMPGFTPTMAFEGEVKIAALSADGPAAKAGLKVGDVITAVNGNEVTTFRTFLRELRVGPRAEDPRQAGAKVKITVKQGEKTLEVELVLVDTVLQGLAGGGAGGPNRGVSATKPYGLGLGGQQPNVQGRQGKDGFQTGGIFQSKDNGETWTRVNSLNARPMYFSVVRYDPTDDNTIYALADVPVLYRSTDGGKRFDTVRTSNGVHADAHAFWINPANAKHLIIGCDGGFYASYDRGLTWDHLNTLALGQFYHVAVDNRRPYRVYGGLQDNGSWGGPSNTMRRYGPVNEDWVFVSGGDGFVCRVDPTDPDTVYAESQGGAMSRRNFRTGEFAGIRPPRKEGDEPLRFNWNTPFILSNHNPSIFYCGAQYVFRSVSKGANLKQISPDLTRSKKGSMTQVAESPRNPDILWAGTDDGNVWVSKDGGANWTNVSDNFKAAGLPGPRWVSSIEASRDKDGKAYVVFDAHRSDDDKPYIFVTEDLGVTWKSLTANLPTFGSTRVLREDIVNNDVLYLGTEFGAWVSTNKGGSWTRLGGNLPTVAVHEFAQPTVANELVIATHGRSIWVTDITSLRQMKAAVLKDPATLFAPSPAVRWRIGAGGESPYSSTDRKFVGTNPTRGATIEYMLNKKAEKLTVKILDVTGKTLRNLDAPPKGEGLHRLTWDLSGTSNQPRGGGGGRNVGGGQVQAGMYKVVLTVDDKEFTQSLLVELDPNAPKDIIAIEGFEEADRAYRQEIKDSTKPKSESKDD